MEKRTEGIRSDDSRTLMKRWKRSNSSRLEQAERDDEGCTERGESTNCEASGAACTIRVSWSGVLAALVVLSALDGSAIVLRIGGSATRRRCGGVTARCESKPILFSMRILRIHLLCTARGRGRRRITTGALIRCIGTVVSTVVFGSAIVGSVVVNGVVVSGVVVSDVIGGAVVGVVVSVVVGAVVGVVVGVVVGGRVIGWGVSGSVLGRSRGRNTEAGRIAIAECDLRELQLKKYQSPGCMFTKSE